MSRVMAVAAREIMARKLVFLTAPAWGVMVAVLGGLHHNPGSVFTAATICALVFTVVMGLVIGAALVGRELAEHRISFYFARPLSGHVIFGGKFLGAAAVVIASAILVLVPSLLAWPRSTSWGEAGSSLAFITAFSMGCLALGIVVGIILRARDGWVAVDLFVGLGTGMLLRGAWILSEGRTNLIPALFVAGAIALVLLIASAAAVIVGRCDLQRAHRAVSLTLLALLPLAGATLILARP